MIEDSERLKVLKMVEAGKISANEAVQLLESLEKAGTKTTESVAEDSARYAGKYLFVKVTDLKRRGNVSMCVCRWGW